MNLCEAIILLVQAIILLGQLCLSKKMFDYERTRDLPYFSIVTNLILHPEIKSRFSQFHNLKDDLVFSAKGNSIVYFCGSVLKINGAIRALDSVPGRVFYTPNDEYSSMLVPLNLHERELTADSVEVTFILKLRNNNNYKYQQIVSLTFEKEKDDHPDWWFLSKYNFDIKPGHN